ncbi:MAG: glycoside hydrolase family 3 N-terminal domain-containing protein [Arachnia sp.]
MTTADAPWFDASRPVDERLEALLAEMTLAEKAGLLFHTMIGIGDLAEPNPVFAMPSAVDLVERRHMTHFNLVGGAQTAREIAAWHNAVQRLARSTRLGIPVTLSSDPRHSFTDNPGTGMLAGPFSQWPEPLGLAAIRDAALVEQFADIARQEYVAVGLRVALHPQVDLATEPRWSRQVATFGEDAELTSVLGAAHVRGFQGAAFGPGSVSTMTKHFPGGGPQKDGEDPHFAHGREQVYPGGQFELHLKPFEALIAAGTRQVMPYYGMPVGTEYEEVAFGFNKAVITGLLRERLAFDGIVCTDWGLINDAPIMGDPFPARAWGVEHLTPEERIALVLEAGADQFGGEACPELLIALVEAGRVSEDRLDTSARRLLREKFALGLFDNPFVDEDAADTIAGRADFRAAGDAAQRASITVLTNGPADAPLLPLSSQPRRSVEHVAQDEATADDPDAPPLPLSSQPRRSVGSVAQDDATAVDPDAPPLPLSSQARHSVEHVAQDDAAADTPPRPHNGQRRLYVEDIARDGVTADGLDDTRELPQNDRLRLYVEGIAQDEAAAYGTVVERPEDADVAVVRLKAPYEQRPTTFENFFHSGSLEFPDEVVEHIRAVSSVVPTVVDIFADRPAILTPIVEAATAVTVNWGASAPALLDVLTGAAKPRGQLPFDLPRSMRAVEDSRPDVPFDTADPLFPFGHGLSYPR